MNEVVYLSPPVPVHMEEEWFNLATLDHFWIKRRFDVLRKLVRHVPLRGLKAGEIGCGHGVVQQQMENEYGLNVDGFDLNEAGLRSSLARNQPRYCYNIFDRNPRFAAAYDLLVLFDVLEHIEQEKPFLEAVLFHLKPEGLLLINVPAFMFLHSRYDDVVGHQRRYTVKSLDAVCSRAKLKKLAGTYWGLPFVPLLLVRRIWLTRQRDPIQVTRSGYRPPGRLANRLLGAVGSLEPIPQPLVGTSLMAIYRKETAS